MIPEEPDKENEFEALLGIADISGYTKFMIDGSKELRHKQAIVTGLLETLIAKIEPTFRVAKLEGDAVFFYRELPTETARDEKAIGAINASLTDYFPTFYTKREEIKGKNLCHCKACDGIEELNIKVIVHAGKVLEYPIKNRAEPEISGKPAITIHRLLKNSIGAATYLLFSDDARKILHPPASLNIKKGTERYDVGQITTYTHYPDMGLLAGEAKENAPQYSFLKKIRATLFMDLVGYALSFGIKKVNLKPSH